MKHYCLGFLFNSDHSRVVLIRKTKPAWQAGKLNGVGGSIEEFETGQRAMAREFEEEAGVLTHFLDWEQFMTMLGNEPAGAAGYPGKFCVDIFRCFSDDYYLAAKTVTEEEIEKHAVVFRSLLTCGDDDIYHHNLEWLIPMALDKGHAGATIHYS